MKRIAIAAAALAFLSGCQSDSTGSVDISDRFADPDMRAQQKEIYRQERVALAAMETHCAAQWAGEPGMVDFCRETQRPKARQFVAAKVTYETMHAGDRTLFASDVKRYRACQAANPGDFEMAAECVKAGKAVATLAARQ